MAMHFSIPTLAATIFAVGVPGLITAEAPDGPPATFEGEIEVIRVITEVRVVDWSGEPVPGLGPEDFEVRLDDQPAAVESATWIEGGGAGPDRLEWTAPLYRAEPRALQPGRLIVILVQTGFQTARLSGLVRTSRHTARLFEKIKPQDRVAIAVFGSHLELHSDFTNDLDLLLEGLKVRSLLRTGVHDEADAYPSLATSFDRSRADDAATLSQAFEVLGDALTPLPGPKSIVLVGWGLGRLTSSGVQLGPDYARAFKALAKARSTVFSLDVTEADFHSLEAGLRAVSSDTGGTYAKTWHFPVQAVTILSRTLAGHYELSILKPPKIDGQYYEVDVKVDRSRSFVLTRPYILVADEADPTPDIPLYRSANPPL